MTTAAEHPGLVFIERRHAKRGGFTCSAEEKIHHRNMNFICNELNELSAIVMQDKGRKGSFDSRKTAQNTPNDKNS